VISFVDLSFASVLRGAVAAGAFGALYGALAFGAGVWAVTGAATSAAARVNVAKAA
jgi:hypothetical protein